MLGELTTRNLRLRPDAPAVFFEGRTITHRDFAARVFRLAQALTRLRVRRGDRVAVLAQNCPEYMEAYAAGEIGGWTTVTINYRLAEAEIAYVLADSQPKVLIAEAALVERLSADTLKPLAHVMTIGGRGPDLAYEDVLAREDADVPHHWAGPDDTAYLVYTSGTTGRPKGVMLGQRGQMRSALLSALDFQVQPTDRLALAMPFYHIGAKNLWLSHSLYGCPIVLHRAFRPAPFLDSLRQYGVTRTLLAPTMLGDMLDTGGFDRDALPSLRRILYSAAPMPEALLRRAIGAFGPVFAQVYGMTESGGPGCSLHADQHVLDGPEHVVRRLRSAGQPMVGCEVRVVRPDGAACAPGEAGEIVIRSGALMTGYWNNHAATLAAIRDGWLHTGDVGERDEEDFVFVVDRIKDMIVSGGENIYSREVENAVMSHPEVLEAAVVGRADARWGEVVVAFVVKRPGAELSADRVVEHCRSLIASYKRPREIRFLDSLPKLPNGKVEKFKLREAARQEPHP